MIYLTAIVSLLFFIYSVRGSDQTGMVLTGRLRSPNQNYRAMWFLPFSIIVVTLLIAIPMSKYIAWIMDGKYRPWPIFRWFENEPR